MNHPALYPSLLAEQWSRLPDKIRGAHSDGGPVHLHGRFQVEVGPSLTSRVLRRILGLPTSESVEEVDLQITPGLRGEDWYRKIGDWRLDSRQTASRGLLCEKFGPLRIRFALQVQDDRLLYRQADAGLEFGPLRMPLPAWLAPEVHAAEEEAPAEFRSHVTVELRSKLAGLIVRYSGCLRGSPP